MVVAAQAPSTQRKLRRRVDTRIAHALQSCHAANIDDNTFTLVRHWLAQAASEAHWCMHVHGKQLQKETRRVGDANEYT